MNGTKNCLRSLRGSLDSTQIIIKFKKREQNGGVSTTQIQRHRRTKIIKKNDQGYHITELQFILA